MTKVCDLGCGDYPVKKKWLDEQLHTDDEYQVIGVGLKTGIDLNPKIDVDWDLNNFPYPFKTNEFDIIVGLNILEHLIDRERVIKEIYRIAKPNAKVILVVPHWSSGVGSWSTLQHRHEWTTQIFSRDMTNYKFKPLVVKVRFISKSREGRVTKFKKHNSLVYKLGDLMDYLANRNLYFFERIWAKWIGFNEIYAILEVEK